jgi:hypothetical protein
MCSRKNVNLKEGDKSYLRMEVTDIGRNHKLESLVQGPYEVIENAGETFRLRIGKETVRVSSDRVTRASVREKNIYPEDHPNPIPSPLAPTPNPSAAEDEPSVVPIPVPRTTRPHLRVRFTLPEPDLSSEYVVDKLVDAAMSEGGHILYRTRWMGYTDLDDTWQEEESLSTHFLRRYWRTKGLTTSQGKKHITLSLSPRPSPSPSFLHPRPLHSHKVPQYISVPLFSTDFPLPWPVMAANGQRHKICDELIQPTRGTTIVGNSNL